MYKAPQFLKRYTRISQQQKGKIQHPRLQRNKEGNRKEIHAPTRTPALISLGSNQQ
jgi:hypothetical protein